MKKSAALESSLFELVLPVAVEAEQPEPAGAAPFAPLPDCQQQPDQSREVGLLLPDVALQPVPAPPDSEPAASVQATVMQQAALVFLEDPIARRLAVAWVACGGNDHEWFEAAGFQRHDPVATRIAKALLRNAVCRPGGITDELAMRYIQAVISRPLSAAAATVRRMKEKG